MTVRELIEELKKHPPEGFVSLRDDELGERVVITDGTPNAGRVWVREP